MASPSPRAQKLADFVAAIRASELLPAADMDALAAAAADPDADAEALARDLVKRNLLTAYQARKLWKGQGADLFLNQYVLMDKIGEGGMGEVFRATHKALGRDVALKVMRRERMANPESVKRFRREIRAAASLSHENVVLAYDADQSGEVHFFAMEYVDGPNLDAHVRTKGPLPVGEACEYARQVALGLQHASEKGLIHRDIKPSNLLLGRSGEVKISDLGLVLVDEPGAGSVSRITKDGLTVGTPDFLAPEQARNPRGADTRADIYSLGCTLYYLLTGTVPHPTGTPTEKMLRHARAPFPVPDRNDLPAGLADVIAKLAAKKPDDRYQTPAEVAEALAPFAVKRPAPPTPRLMTAILADEVITEDTLPIPVPAVKDASTATRFALPEVKPRPARKGCLGVVLLGLVAVVWLWR
ncbi:MAG TPA: serine/threonine-protein kinase [Gemmataceae bacterium]|jgi:serine/threonine protein kinase|nr:serine/threonine-protein kinase [Gemmataceae bacterium]